MGHYILYLQHTNAPCFTALLSPAQRGVCVCGEAGRIDTKIQMKSMSSWLKVNDKHISGPNKCNVFFTKCIFCQKNKL